MGGAVELSTASILSSTSDSLIEDVSMFVVLMVTVVTGPGGTVDPLRILDPLYLDRFESWLPGDDFLWMPPLLVGREDMARRGY